MEGAPMEGIFGTFSSRDDEVGDGWSINDRRNGFRWHTKTTSCADCGNEFESKAWESINRKGELDWDKKCSPCLEKFLAASRAASEERYKAEQRADRIKRLGIPELYREKATSFDNFICETDQQRKYLDAVREFADEFIARRRNGQCWIFSGPVGTGKTLLAWQLLYAVTAAGRGCDYVTLSRFFMDLRACFQPNARASEKTLFSGYAELPLLVIDEIGLKQTASEFELERISQLIDERYNERRSTVLISNLGIEGITKVIGERAVDRLREHDGRVLVFKGSSWRKRRTELNMEDAQQVAIQ